MEDDPGEALHLCQLLGSYPEQFRIQHHVTLLAEAEAAIQTFEVDLILLDLSLPDGEGIEGFLSHGSRVPILLLSAPQEQPIAAQFLRAGAQDFLVKGTFDGGLLSRAMQYAVQRSSAEQALAHERNLLHALLETIPDRIYFKDVQSHFLRINPALAALFKLERPEDAIGKTDFDFFSPEHAQPAFEDEMEIMRTGQPIIGKVEKEILPDGKVYWALTTKLAMRDRGGRIIGTMGLSRDITALKRMEDELATERNLLRNVIDNIPDPIFVKDTQGHYVLDNAAHCISLNIDPREGLIGRTVYDFFPPEKAREFQEDDERVIATGEPMFNHEECVRDSAGHARWLLTTKVAVRDPETAQVTRLVGIRRDITQQKLAEDKLLQANADLSLALSNLKEASEQLRTIQLQLIEAEKMKSIGRLAAGVAHEVKNPLAIINMGVDYLESMGPGADNAAEILKEMRTAVKRADKVIRGLLDFSAPRHLELGEASLAKILEHALILVRGEMSSGKFEVITEIAPDLPLLHLDAVKVEQVFINLMTNAIHAMPQGGILGIRAYSKQLTSVGENLSAAVNEVFHTGDQVVIAEIDDTGTGIPENKLGKIFDPFFTTKPTGKGTGLGLTVTRSIIDLHGGLIDITNRPEGGARATVMFRV